MKILLCIVFVLALCNYTRGSCPSRKVSRKRQLSRMRSMDENVVIVEATYWGKSGSIFTFEIDSVWEKQNGNLYRHSTITVTASETTVADCFEELGSKRSYILVLQPQEESNLFRAIEPPVQSDRRRDQRHRQAVWEKVCAKVEDQSKCKTRVSLPESEDIYRGIFHIMECKVESSTAISSVEWEKDGKTLGSVIHEKAGITISVDGPSAIVIIQHANHIHNGEYACTAISADGQVAKGYTSLRVVGPQESSKRICPEDTYCVNGGVCYQEPDGSNRYCECPSSFTGPRCENIYFDVLPSGSKDIEEMESKVSQLTVAVVLVAVAFAGVLFFGSIYVFQLRRKASQKKDKYQVVEQCCPVLDQPIDGRTTSSTSAGTEATQSRQSTIVVPEVANSRRPSAQVVNLTPNGSKREHLTPRLSISSSHYDDLNVKSPSSHSMSRHSSITSDRSFRRERLNAKSKS